MPESKQSNNGPSHVTDVLQPTECPAEPRGGERVEVLSLAELGHPPSVFWTAEPQGLWAGAELLPTSLVSRWQVEGFSASLDTQASSHNKAFLFPLLCLSYISVRVSH